MTSTETDFKTKKHLPANRANLEDYEPHFYAILFFHSFTSKAQQNYYIHSVQMAKKYPFQHIYVRIGKNCSHLSMQNEAPDILEFGVLKVCATIRKVSCIFK